ncbi:MAG: hypothetical protein JNG90_04830 [Planctomycetaceae bacterium]|nr:hypothetical protein [Planctomycetaceae bacterium]
MNQLPLETHDENRARDATSFLLLGSFFSILATLVLIGTLWTLDRPRAMVVNLSAGGLLLLIGLIMLYAGRRVQRSRRREARR